MGIIREVRRTRSSPQTKYPVTLQVHALKTTLRKHKADVVSDTTVKQDAPRGENKILHETAVRIVSLGGSETPTNQRIKGQLGFHCLFTVAVSSDPSVQAWKNTNPSSA